MAKVTISSRKKMKNSSMIAKRTTLISMKMRKPKILRTVLLILMDGMVITRVVILISTHITNGQRETLLIASLHVKDSELQQ